MSRFFAAYLIGVLLLISGCRGTGTTHVDVCVYGGTSSGVMAAVAVAKQGKKVVLIEPGRHLGGMTSSGLGKTDIVNKSVIGGSARKFYQRVGIIYGAPEAWNFEPHAAERVFRNLIAENKIGVRYQTRVREVKKQGTKIASIVLETDEGRDAGEVEAKVYIDASYEGDVMARAGVSYVVGRESRKEFGEPLNGVRRVTPKHQFRVKVDPYVRPGDPSSGLIPLIQPGDAGTQGAADRKVQAYCFRLCLTQDPNNKIEITAPPNYDARKYELLARYIESLIAHGFRPALRHFLQIDEMPHGKTDINNNGAVSTDFIGANWNYANAGYEERKRIWEDHENYERGLLYFLATDPRVPQNMRSDMRSWGFCKDEFTDNGGWPHQLYVREARRMRGRYVITEVDCENVYAAADSIAMGSYSMDSHNCQRVVQADFVVNEGDVQVRSRKPYPISYSAITPKEDECDNLLVPVCLSATHIAYSSIRMEPVLMAIGESAGVAACEALDESVSVQKPDIVKLRSRLAKLGQVLQLR